MVPPANHTSPVNASEEPAGSAAALAVVDDYGEIGEGASNARYVLAENGTEYIIKGPSLVPGHPTVAANEWIAARLGEFLALPILDHRIVTMGGRLFFASSWMQKPSFYPAIDESLFNRCGNRDRVYGVVVFDCWLINQDRHGANLVVRHAKNGDHLLLLNDHSHLLVSPLGPAKTEDLMSCVADPPQRFVRLPFIRAGVTDPAHIRSVLDQVEALSDAEIRSAVNSTPQELLSNAEQDIYIEFLLKRQACLREVLHNGSAAFPNLEGSI
jgi:HipA-like kinase